MSARFALWFTAWAGGAASLDDTRDAIIGGDTAHDVAGLPGADGSVPLILALGRLRSAGATGAGIALPAPGDPLGLAGPVPFNAEAVDAGEAVLVDGAGLGLVPRATGAGVVWTAYPAVTRRQVPDPSEAIPTLRRTLVHTSTALADLDVARWRPEAADELMAVRRGAALPLPDGVSAWAMELAALALRCRHIVDLALADDGGAVTADEADRRRAALAPLDHAARRGLVAACSFGWGR